MLISKSFLSPSLSFPRSVSRPITQPVWARAYNLNQCMNCKRLKNFGLKLRLLRFSLFISFIARSLCLSIAWQQQQQQQLIRRAIRIFWAYKHTTMTICVAACVYVWANEKDWGKKKYITIKLSNSPTPSNGNKSKYPFRRYSKHYRHWNWNEKIGFDWKLNVRNCHATWYLQQILWSNFIRKWSDLHFMLICTVCSRYIKPPIGLLYFDARCRYSSKFHVFHVAQIVDQFTCSVVKKSLSSILKANRYHKKGPRFFVIHTRYTYSLYISLTILDLYILQFFANFGSNNTIK